MKPTQNSDGFLGEVPNQADLFWLEVVRDRAKESIRLLEDTAKQFVTITSFAQTVYFAAISFGEVKKGLTTVSPFWQFVCTVLLLCPLACWVSSLIFATHAFTYKRFRTNIDSPSAAQEFYDDIVGYKSKQIKLAYRMLIAGFVLLIVNIFFYLLFFPLPPTKEKAG
jgi:hypothetical protein